MKNKLKIKYKKTSMYHHEVFYLFSIELRLLSLIVVHQSNLKADLMRNEGYHAVMKLSRYTVRYDGKEVYFIIKICKIVYLTFPSQCENNRENWLKMWV